MRIGSLNEGNFQDYDEGLCSVIFTLGCNYRCPVCHAKNLLEGENCYKEEEILNRIRRKKDYIKRVVICGGEPTLQLDLVSFARKLKESGSVKLDTNGSQYSVLQELKEQGLIDYVAMDVKGPPKLYPTIVGREYLDLRDEVEKGMAITSQFPDYEFRTTVVPVIRDEDKISFMTVEEVVSMAKWIVEITGSDEHRYYLQPFVPRKGELVDSRFGEFPETSKELLEEMQKEVKKYLPNCRVR